jgi:MoaA/NifB/PqqE/SkfB family radical SAM enzyme
MFIDIQETASIRMNGWHHDANFCQNKIGQGEMIHLLAETSNVCDQDCEYCYTVLLTLDKPNFHAKALPGELEWVERKRLIDEAAKLNTVTYDMVGAGEPLIDPLFLRQTEYAVSKGMTPVIFTNGSILGHKKHGEKFAQKLWDLGATVVVKWHSAEQQVHDEIVRRKGAGEKRDRALRLLKEFGFNKTKPTRLGIDNIIYDKTLGEMPNCLRMCRQENIFLVCSTFIPSGRTQKGNEREAEFSNIVRIFKECQKIDGSEFGIIHSASMPYLGYGKTCTQYMGLYVTIQGEVYGCVGQSEAYGNIRKRRLSEVWQERLPLLQRYDGGCPPRQKFYEQRVEHTQLKVLF